METTQAFENKSRTLATDPQYFGGYLNMSRLNIYNINNYLACEFGLSPLPEEGRIKSSFLTNKNQPKLNWNRVYSKAVTFLPILKIFDSESLPKSERENKSTPEIGKDFAKMSDALSVVFSEIQEFRNDYSHYYSTEKGTDRKITISNELTEFLSLNYNRGIEYTKTRFKDVYTDEDFNVASKKQMVKGNTITTEGLVFLTSMFLEREYAFQFIGKITGLKGTQYVSFRAFRDVLMAFCIRLPHEKLKSDDFIQSFTLDMINELNRCPKTLYNVITEEEKMKFRPQLEPEKVDNLLKNSGIELEEFDENYDDYVESLTKQVRHENRFSYFALRFIDEHKILGKYHFHIDLGKLVIDEYPKKFFNEEVQRRIIENAKAFGRLNEFTEEKEILKKIDIQNHQVYFEPFAPHYHTENNKIALLSKHGISILRMVKTKNGVDRKNLFQPLPEAFLSLAELYKIVLLEYLKPGEPERLIADFILVNNSKLMNMQFIEQVKKLLPNWPVFQKETDTKSKLAYSKINFEELLNRKIQLNKILAVHNLNDKQIPSRILEYWLNMRDVKQQFTTGERIKLMKRDCMTRLKALRKFKVTGKGKIPKIGEMATFLAKDIVDMVIGKEKKQKITSFYYDKMQECLALYADPEKKKTFIHIITHELGLYEKDGHPFLTRINFGELRYTRDIYEKYLEEKGEKMVKVYNARRGNYTEKDKSWLRETFYTLVEKEVKGKPRMMTEVVLPAGKSGIPFTIRQLEEKTNYTLADWLRNITKGKEQGDGKKPVNLPTNLFDETIATLLKTELDKKRALYPENAKMNELFKLWWKNRDDGVQEFYEAEREYFVFEQQVRFQPGSKPKFSDYYQNALEKAKSEKVKKAKSEGKPEPEPGQIEKTFQQAIAGTEKEIRELQEEDRVCLLMLEKLMGREKQIEIKLKSIGNLLNETVTVKQKVSGKLYFDENGNEIKDKTNPIITKTIVDKRKGKDYGLLRKFANDRRVPELFEYFADDEIPLEQLKKELDGYNIAKQMVFDAVFRLEEKLIQNNREAIISRFTDKNGNPQTGNLQHHPYLQLLKEKNLLTPDEIAFMNMARNCFSHNQFPKKSVMEKETDTLENNFAQKIADIYNLKTEALITKVE